MLRSLTLTLGVLIGGNLMLTSLAQGLPDLTIDVNRLQDSLLFEKRGFGKGSCAAAEGCVLGNGKRTLMRFDLTTPNIGTADLVLGDPTANPDLFHFDACHGHYHFEGYAWYELINASGTQIITGRKQAFCLMDSEPWLPDAGPRTYTCSFQGISAGWADTYGRVLDCQWLDITGVPPGNYLLRVTVNPLQQLPESDYSNNIAIVPVTIPQRIR
jgi:hypothetical protein